MNAVAQEQDSKPVEFPHLRDQLTRWQGAVAETDWTPWLIVGLGAFLRLLLLGIKPPHFDEGINGWFVDAHIIKQGFYRYDPTNYHGPLHFYVLFLFKCLFGRSLWALRLPVVIVSTTCIWLMMRFEPFVSRNAVRIAALAMAVSPAFVFYGRYSIHEAWLVLFSMMFMLGLIGLWRTGASTYLWCLGLGASGMILTKETYVLHIGCALIALAVFQISNYLHPVGDAAWAKQRWDYVDLGTVVLVGLALIIFFYSGTFLHWSGVKGIFQAYVPWFKTGSEGHGHDKVWYYWLDLIGRYEPAVLAGLLVCGLVQQMRSSILRYLAIYAVGTVGAYSIINYKTPWCIISIVWPFLILFGVLPEYAPLRFKRGVAIAIAALLLGLFVVALVGWRQEWFQSIGAFALAAGGAILLLALSNRTATRAVMAVALIYSLGYSIVLNYFRCTTDTEPYVYVQTYNDIFKLTRPLLTLAHRNPVYYHMPGLIIRQSSYPLPWMLGDFSSIGYYEHDTLPAKLDADFLVVQEDKVEAVEAKMKDAYYTDEMRIRAYQDKSKIYFNARRFHDIFPDREPDFVGSSER